MKTEMALKLEKEIKSTIKWLQSGEHSDSEIELTLLDFAQMVINQQSRDIRDLLNRNTAGYNSMINNTMDSVKSDIG